MNSYKQRNKETFIIFLDIDGVLNNFEFINNENYIVQNIINIFPNENPYTNYDLKKFIINSLNFNVDALNALNTLIYELSFKYNVEIIISSAWRKDWSVEQLKQIFQFHYFAQFIKGKTLDTLSIEDIVNYNRIFNGNYIKSMVYKNNYNQPTQSRFLEIQNWLDNNEHYNRFIILDDMDDYLSNFNFKFYKINPNTLLTMSTVNTIICQN